MRRSILTTFGFAGALLGAVALDLAGAPSARAQDTVKIGVLGPMAFVQGEHHWLGAEMARDEINQAGGISVGGRKLMIELVRGDTNEIQSVPDATNAVERVISRDRVDVLVGGFRSEAVLAMEEIAADYKKLFLGAGSSHSKLGLNVEQNYDRYKYWFRVSPLRDVDLGRSVFTMLGFVIGQMRKDLGKPTPKVAILAEKAVWTEAIVAGAQKTLPQMKVEIVGLWQPSATATDVTAELAAIERAGADIVFTVLSGPVGISVGRQMGERNMKAIAFGINVEAQKADFWKATAGKGNYVSTLETVGEVEITPKTLPFLRAFEARYKKNPIFTAAGAYDAIMLFRQAVEQAGTLDADKLVPVIETMPYTGVAGVIEFDKRHDPVWGIGKLTGIAVQWQDGRKAVFWPTQYKGTVPFRMPQ